MPCDVRGCQRPGGAAADVNGNVGGSATQLVQPLAWLLRDDGTFLSPQ
jgi:hypothetical protein